MENKKLKIEINNNVLSISIGVNTLCLACEIGRRHGTGSVKVTDRKLFVENLVHQLESEESDGTTLIHSMLDSAVTVMIENGEAGVGELTDADAYSLDN